MELKQNKRLPRTRAKARAKTMATANRVELCRLDCSCLSNANYKIKYARTRARIHPRAMHRQLEPETRRVVKGQGGERAAEIFLATVLKCVGNANLAVELPQLLQKHPMSYH